MVAVANFVVDAVITSRGQTTIPAVFRRMLGVQKGQISFKGMSDGTIVIAPKDETKHEDPAIGAFLQLLEKDIVNGNAAPLQKSMLDELNALVGDADVDMDAPLSDD